MLSDIVWDAKGHDELCVNNSKTIKEYAKRFPRGHWSSLGPGSEKKWYGIYDGKPDVSWNRTAEKMLQNFKDSGHPIFRCTSTLERGQLRSKGGGKTTIHFNGSTENIELLLQIVISVNQLSLHGAVADMIAELPDDQIAPGKPVASGQLGWTRNYYTTFSRRIASQWRATGKPTARVRGTIWDIVRRPEVIQTMLRSRFEISRSWTILLCPSVTKRNRKSIFMPRVYVASRSKRYWNKRIIPKQCTFWTSLGHKSSPWTRKIQYCNASSIFVSRSNRILDKNCERYWQVCQRIRADPRGRESFGETRCWSKTSTETVINEWLGLYSCERETMDWHWNTGIQRSSLFSSVKIHCSIASTRWNKCVEKRMEESITTKWLKNARKRYQTIQVFGQTKWRSNSLLRTCSALVNWKMNTNSGKRWRTEEKVSIFAWTRTVLRTPCTSGQSKDIQEVQSILHCKTMCCYQKVLPSIFITSETEQNLRSTVNHGLIPGGVSLKTGRHAVFFTVVTPMDNQDGFGETLCDLSKARIAPYKNTWKHFQDTVQFEARSTKRTAILSNKIKRSYSLRHIACKVHWESDMHEDQGSVSFIRGRAWFWDRVLFLELIRKVVDKIYLYKKHDHLGNRNKMRRGTGNPKQHCWLWSTRYIDLNGETAGRTATKQRHKTYRDVRKNIGKRNSSLKKWVKSRRSQGSARNHNNYSKILTKQRSSNFARILQKNNDLVAIHSCKEIGIFSFAVAGDIWSTSGVLQQPRRLLATFLQSLALSLRRILLENQITDNLNDKSCSRQRRCLRKQDSQNTGTIQRFSHDGLQKKRYRSSLAEHKIGEKEIMLYDRIALERHDYTATRAERLQNASHWVLRLNAEGFQKPLRQRQEFVGASKQCLKMQDAHQAETQQSLRPTHPQHRQRQRQNQQFEGGENFDHKVDRKPGWRYYRKPRWNPPAASSSSSSTLQWPTSWSSWQSTSCEKWWWFRCPGKNSRKSTESGQNTHKHRTYSAVQPVHKRGTHITRLAQGPARLKNCSVIFVRLKIVLSSGVLHMSIIGCCLTCRAPRAHLLPHALFLLPRHRNTHYNRDNTIYSKNTQCISKHAWSKSIAIKNHSGVKISRVTETCHHVLDWWFRFFVEAEWPCLVNLPIPTVVQVMNPTWRTVNML